jgi:dTDP-4-amino-4,6-dideoxygalactose transaminase
MSDMRYIRNWQYLKGYEAQRKDMLRIVDGVFSSGRLILGSKVAEFERAFSSFCGCRYGVGVNSGTDALFLALKAVGTGEGDEVVTVSNTAVPTVAAIRAAGATPVFVDVEEDTFLMDVSLVEKAVTSRTRAFVPVHLFGQPVDMGRLMGVARQKKIKIVEDCAQAAGAVYRGRRVGCFGDIGAFSFYPTKILGAFGDAGMAVTNHKRHYEKLRRLRYYGMDREYHSEEEGYNSRIDEVQAAILNHKLRGINEAVGQRKRIAALYADGLAGVGDVILPTVREDRTHQFYSYTIRTRRRKALMEFLADKRIEARVNYPVPVHLMRGYRRLGYSRGDLPVTERLAGEMLSLPIYPDLSDKDAERVVKAVRAFFNKPFYRAGRGGAR